MKKSCWQTCLSYLKNAVFSFIGEGVGKNAMIRAPASEVTIGKPKDFPSYGWDNEYGEWKVK